MGNFKNIDRVASLMEKNEDKTRSLKISTDGIMDFLKLKAIYDDISMNQLVKRIILEEKERCLENDKDFKAFYTIKMNKDTKK